MLYMQFEHMPMQRALPMIFWIAQPSGIGEFNLLFSRSVLK
jgi:hypothetical protein